METFARDVLPTGVRRRHGLRDGMLPAVLLGELLAGVALGAAWPRLVAPPGTSSQNIPVTAVVAPVSAPQTGVVSPAVVPAALSVPAVLPAAVPAPAHTPATPPSARNPFAALHR